MSTVKNIVSFFPRMVTTKKGESWEPEEKASGVDVIRRLTAIGIIIGSVLLIIYVKATEHYTFHWETLVSFKQAYWMGFLMTMKLSTVTLFLSIIVGGVVGLASVSRRICLRDLAMAYVEGIRNVPLLVIVLLTYFGIGTLFHLPRFSAAVIALTAFESTFFAEIIRGGIESIPRGQMWAGRSLGLSYGMTMRGVILPQAVRRVVPALAGQFVNLVKDSSLASVISLVELTLIGRQIMTATFAAFESYIAIAVFYFSVCFTLSLLTKILERKIPVD
ncbi:MAG: ABC transporter permease subunit [Proteobacteria bacterium]|nr:ABC transporter permease subunit [Pseudomonadota bacterium]